MKSVFDPSFEYPETNCVDDVDKRRELIQTTISFPLNGSGKNKVSIDILVGNRQYVFDPFNTNKIKWTYHSIYWCVRESSLEKEKEKEKEKEANPKNTKKEGEHDQVPPQEGRWRILRRIGVFETSLYAKREYRAQQNNKPMTLLPDKVKPLFFTNAAKHVRKYFANKPGAAVPTKKQIKESEKVCGSEAILAIAETNPCETTASVLDKNQEPGVNNHQPQQPDITTKKVIEIPWSARMVTWKLERPSTPIYQLTIDVSEIRRLLFSGGSVSPNKEATEQEKDGKKVKPTAKKPKKAPAKEEHHPFFIEAWNSSLLSTVPVESEKDSRSRKMGFQKNGASWIQRFFLNNNYQLSNTALSGTQNTLLDVVVEAYAKLGLTTSTPNLRKTIADHLPLDYMEGRMKCWTNALQMEEQRQCKIDMWLEKFDSFKKVAAVAMKEKDKLTFEKKEHFKRVLTSLRQKHEEAKKKLSLWRKTPFFVEADNWRSFAKLTPDFETNEWKKSPELFRQFVCSSEFVLDEPCILFLEYLLDIKFLFLDQTAFAKEDVNNVLRVTGGGPAAHHKIACASPKLFLLLSVTHQPHLSEQLSQQPQFSIVSYFNNTWFSFNQLPFDIKVLLCNKAVEGNVGNIATMSEFRNLKAAMKLDADVGEWNAPWIPFLTTQPPQNTEQPPMGMECTPEVVCLSIHAKAPVDVLPGNCNGEFVTSSDLLLQFDTFLTEDEYGDWRRVLSDENLQFPFTVPDPDHLGGLVWASVRHFVVAQPFRLTQPMLYRRFSLHPENGDETLNQNIAMSLEEARKHAEQTPSNQEMIDLAARQIALECKFASEIPKKMLLATKTSQLYVFQAKQKPMLDWMLMQLRGKLATSSSYQKR